MTTNNGICADCNKETELNAIGGTCVTCGSNSIVKPGAAAALESKQSEVKVDRILIFTSCYGCLRDGRQFVVILGNDRYLFCDHCMSSINEQYKNLIVAERSIVKEEKDGNL